MRPSTLWTAALIGAAVATFVRVSADDVQVEALTGAAPAVPVGELTRLVPGAEYRPTRLAATNDERAAIDAPASEAAPRPARFEVVGTRGEPVAAARLSWERDASRAVFTDAGGAAASELPADAEGARVRVSAEGYRTTVVELALADDGTQRIVLSDGGVLAGVVTRVSGAAAPEGTCVLAWPVGDTPDVVEVLRAREGGLTDALRVARTDAAGRFRFEGLERDAAFELAAVRDGEVATERLASARTGRVDLALELRPIVAAAVRLVDAEGGAPRASDGLFAGHSVWDPVEPDLHARHLPTDGVEVAWIGGAELADVARGGRDRYLMVYEPHGDAFARPANVTLSLRVPGYAPVWTSVPLERLDARLALRELPVERRAERWGHVDVAVTGAEGWIERSGEAKRRAFGLLRLVPEGDGETLSYALQPDPDGRWRVDGVPCGRYRVELALRDASGALPARGNEALVVDVAPEGAEVSLDLRGRGAGEVVVARADGSDYDGELVLLLRKGADGAGPVRFVRFEGAPYVFAGLEEGEYEVSVQTVGGMPAEGTPGSRMWLAENSLAACLIHLR